MPKGQSGGTPIPCPCRRPWQRRPATKALSRPAAVLERAHGASSLTADPAAVQAAGACPPSHQTNYTSCSHYFRVRKNNNTSNKGPPRPCLEERRRRPGKPPSEQAAELPGATGRGQAAVCASRAPAGPNKLDVQHLENTVRRNTLKIPFPLPTIRCSQIRCLHLLRSVDMEWLHLR